MRRGPWVAGALAGVTYLALAPRVTGPDDSGGLTLALALAGVPHPTGYPLYVLLGHFFVTILHGAGAGWSYAANAWSALGAAVAIGLYAALALRLSGNAGSAAWWAPAAAAVVVLAIHPAWIAAATVAEVYSWAFAWHAGAALWGLGALERIESGAARGSRLPAAWGALVGLGLSHHLVSVWLALPLTVALARAAWKAGLWRARWIAAVVAGALVPLTGYGWIAWRAHHPAPFQWPLLEASAPSVMEHVTGRIYRAYLGRFTLTEEHRTLLAFTVFPILIAGLTALAFLVARQSSPSRRGWLAAILAAAVLEMVFATAYGVPDPAAYFVPPLMVALLALPLLAARVGRRHSVAVALSALLLALAPAPSWIRHALAERRRLAAVEERIVRTWRRIPFERGIVLWDDDHYTRLKLLQLLGAERPGLDVENPSMLTWPAPRAAFQRRWGFDPLEGLALDDASALRLVPANVARLAPVPVLDFAVFAGQESSLR